MAGLPGTPDLATIVTPGGASFRVAKQYQDQFQGLVNQLEAGGYTLDPRTSGGYNRRYIAGTTTPSQHAFGQAIDVNWNDNPRGGMGKIPADVARAVASQYGMTWGGDWKNPDPMHFEVARARANAAPPQPGISKFGIATANLPPPETGADYGGGSDPQPAAPAAPNDDAYLRLALARRGGFGLDPSAFIPEAQTAQPQPTSQMPRPINAPIYQRLS